jgi:Ser/Thr protein kinase RdoA (MazF antagonist)
LVAVLSSGRRHLTASLALPERPPAPSFDLSMSRMYRRKSVDTLPAHLEAVLDITVSRVHKLDVGVFRVDRVGAPPVVARLFSKRRPHHAVRGDLAVLQQLQAADYPAERPVGAEPLSIHDGQSVLVTDFVRKASKSAVPVGDQVAALGARVARLHGSMSPTGEADRPAGALHHYAEGAPAEELRAAQQWLRDIEPRVALADRSYLDVLRQALADADDSTGLPEAFVHPDPVPKNAVFTRDGPVLVDWAGAGRGPRLTSLALVLGPSWAGPRFMSGYGASIELDADERRRAPEVLMTRALIDMAFKVCFDPAVIAQQVKRIPSVGRRTHALAATALAAAP